MKRPALEHVYRFLGLGYAGPMERALLEHSYAQLRIAIVGMTGVVAVGFTVMNLDPPQPYRFEWLAWSVGCIGFSVVVHFARNLGKLDDPKRARLARRAAGVANGSIWGLAGVLWPMEPHNEFSLGLVLALTAFATGCAFSLAADPISWTSTLAPVLPGLWLTESTPYQFLIAAVYGLGCFALTWQNHRTLVGLLRLRFENVALLTQTIAEREAAARARDKAEEAAASKTRFLAAASHDLRQPVQALLLFTDALTREDSTDARRAEAAGALKRSTNALSLMLDRLLDLSRYDAGLAVNEPTTVDLQQLLRDVAAGLGELAHEHDAVISAAGPRLAAYADPVLLGRVVTNLATNALRHSGSDRVLLSARARGDERWIQVWDQGVGIVDSEQERVFEEFVQLDNPAREREKGLGLGLAMVRRICELAGWDLTLRSEAGRGTVCRVVVPASERFAASAVRAHEPLGIAARVLVVEDDEMVAEALAAFLEGRGVHVVRAANSHRARRVIEVDGAFQLILSDHDLPGEMSGAELLEWAGRAVPTVGRILMTGNIGSMTARDAGLLGQVRVLHKPVSTEALWDALRAQLLGSGDEERDEAVV